jgi:hypothetical protein
MRIALLMLAAVLVRAKIVDSAAGGFTVRTTLHVKAAPDVVYNKLVHNIGDWWNPMHTFSGDAHNLRIETHPGGCLCEKLANDGFTRHLEVITAMPGNRIVMIGAMGPLQTLAATGTLSVNLTSDEGGTKMDVIYAVTGYLPKGIDNWAIPADLMVSEQFTRLQSYVETGSAVASK